MFLDYLNHSTKACVTYKTTYCIQNHSSVGTQGGDVGGVKGAS